MEVFDVCVRGCFREDFYEVVSVSEGIDAVPPIVHNVLMNPNEPQWTSMHNQQGSNKKEELLVGGLSNSSMFYQIEAKELHLLLRSEVRSFRSLTDIMRVTGALKRPHQIQFSSLWLLKEESKKFEIVHVKTDNVMTVDNQEIKLERGKMKNSQKFTIVNVGPNLYKIKDCYDNYLLLDGNLQTAEGSEREESTLFTINAISQFASKQLQKTVIIGSPDGKYLDLLNGSREGENDVVLYHKHYRLNQRWTIDKIKDDADLFVVRNVLTRKCLLYDLENRRLVQSEYPEKWKIEFLGQSKATIECVEEGTFLGISYDKIGLQERPYMWKIEKKPESEQILKPER